MHFNQFSYLARLLFPLGGHIVKHFQTGLRIPANSAQCDGHLHAKHLRARKCNIVDLAGHSPVNLCHDAFDLSPDRIVGLSRSETYPDRSGAPQRRFHFFSENFKQFLIHLYVLLHFSLLPEGMGNLNQPYAL